MTSHSPIKENFDVHVKAAHLKVKGGFCRECEISFSQKGELAKHVKAVHAKIKDYQCSECDKAFSQKGNLDDHVNKQNDQSDQLTPLSENAINGDK